jgi:hypothetical protein
VVALTLPEERQFGCLLLSREDGWALRELMRPYDAPPELREMQQQFLRRLYEALLRMHVLDLPTYGITMTIEDCLLVNQYVKSGAWQGADALLLQTWQVLHELTEQQPLRARSIVITEFVLTTEEGHAIHHTGEADAGADNAGDSG